MNVKILVSWLVSTAVLCSNGEEVPVVPIILGLYEWKNMTRTDLISSLKELSPAGVQPDGLKQYICRANVYNYWRSGKLVFDSTTGNLTCDVGANYVEVRVPVEDIENIQVLVFFVPEAVSWVPLPPAGTALPALLIQGGQNINGAVYICRYADDGRNLFLGQFFTDARTCWYPYDGDEIEVSSGVEILAVNYFGFRGRR